MMTAGTLRTWYDFGMRKTARKIFARAMSAVRCTLLPLGFGASNGFERSRYGVWLRANWRDRTFQYCLYGTYGTELADGLCARNIPFVFLDIGANQGLFSLIAAKNRDCVRVIAFEPVAATFDLLNANIEANDLGAKILAVRAAISNEAGDRAIWVDHTHSGAASLRQDMQQPAISSETIRLISCAELGSLVPDGYPIMVKIDVEGHEAVVISELMQSVHCDWIDSIFYEIDERWLDPLVIQSQLEKSGFNRFTKLGIGRHYDILAQR
jgi:FkbM family methyltransferase